MSAWESSYLLAGYSIQIRSAAGNPTAYLPANLPLFLLPEGTGLPADLVIHIGEDERAEADPLKRLFPPSFRMRRGTEGIRFEREDGRGEPLGSIEPDMRRAFLGLPNLARVWRLPEEEEAVRDTLQGFLKGCLQWLLLRDGGTLLHAAGVALRGRGFAFAGHTRAGKTTLAGCFPPEAVLGDDLVALRREGHGFTLYGTPWPGREGGRVAYGGIPLAAVFNLHHELPEGLHAVTPAEAAAELAANAPRTGEPSEESELLEAFSSLAASVSIYRLSVRLGEDVMRYLEGFLLP